MQSQPSSILPDRREERREEERVRIGLSGKLFVPADEATADCEILDLSRSGAGLRCNEPPPLHSFVVLYIDGFGRFEGVTTRFVEGELGLRFVCTQALCDRLLKDVVRFMADGTIAATRLRQHTRETSAAAGYFALPDGRRLQCEILDISLQGISLRTSSRPPIGSFVNLGRTHGRVTRHHADGIAVRFFDVVSAVGEPDGD